MENTYKVSVIGAGFVGLPTSAVLAHNNPNLEFLVYDSHEKVIKSCIDGIMPFYQPKMQQMINELKTKNLKFSTNLSDALDKASVIFLALPSPTKNFGQFAGKAYDTSYTEQAIEKIVNYYNTNPQRMSQQLIIVQKSTVPVDTGIMVGKIIQANAKPQLKSRYIITSNPQFLSQGSAINDLTNPDRVIIGCRQQDKDISKLLNLYHFAANKIIRTDSSSSELAKVVSNCFLAQRVSSINSISLMCEKYQSDVAEVRRCVGSDTRIGDKFLNSSVGFGGNFFQKDLLALIYLAQCKGHYQVARYWQAVIDMNNYRKKTFFQRIYQELHSNLKNKKLAIFGIAFKKDTSQVKQSPALQICKHLLIEGAILNIYDPKAKRDKFIKQMIYQGVWQEKFDQRLIQCKSADEAVVGCSAIVIITEWDEFKELDYASFYNKVSKPALIFDGRNILDEKKIGSTGFKLCRIGKKFYP